MITLLLKNGNKLYENSGSNENIKILITDLPLKKLIKNEKNIKGI